MSRPKIEAARPEDMAFVVEMVALTLKSLPQLASKRDFEIEGMARLETGMWQPGRDWAFVAYLNGSRAGAVWLRVQDETDLPQFELGIAVAPAFQRQGIGQSLLEYALDYCRRHGGNSVSLKVNPGNEPALRLYRRFGFTELSLEMRKKL